MCSHARYTSTNIHTQLLQCSGDRCHHKFHDVTCFHLAPPHPLHVCAFISDLRGVFLDSLQVAFYFAKNLTVFTGRTYFVLDSRYLSTSHIYQESSSLSIRYVPIDHFYLLCSSLHCGDFEKKTTRRYISCVKISKVQQMLFTIFSARLSSRKYLQELFMNILSESYVKHFEISLAL